MSSYKRTVQYHLLPQQFLFFIGLEDIQKVNFRLHRRILSYYMQGQWRCITMYHISNNLLRIIILYCCRWMPLHGQPLHSDLRMGFLMSMNHRPGHTPRYHPSRDPHCQGPIRQIIIHGHPRAMPSCQSTLPEV